jgi:hypothetical protein
MQEQQYPELSKEELHELMNGPFAQEIMKSVENSMRYLHEHFL